MRKSQPFQILSQLGSKFPVAKVPVSFPHHSPPGTQMHFVDGDGGIKGIVGVSFLHPYLVSPVVSQIPDDRGCLGRCFTIEGKRVRFLYAIAAMMRDNVILVNCALSHPGNKSFPYTGLPFRVEKVT